MSQLGAPYERKTTEAPGRYKAYDWLRMTGTTCCLNHRPESTYPNWEPSGNAGLEVEADLLGQHRGQRDQRDLRVLDQERLQTYRSPLFNHRNVHQTVALSRAEWPPHLLYCMIIFLHLCSTATTEHRGLHVDTQTPHIYIPGIFAAIAGSGKDRQAGQIRSNSKARACTHCCGDTPPKKTRALQTFEPYIDYTFRSFVSQYVRLPKVERRLALAGAYV